MVPTDEERQAAYKQAKAHDDAKRPVWQQQALIRGAAEHLLLLLDHTVPNSTAHYAVEGARRALRVLVHKAEGVQVHGWNEWKAFERAQEASDAT